MCPGVCVLCVCVPVFLCSLLRNAGKEKTGAAADAPLALWREPRRHLFMSEEEKGRFPSVAGARSLASTCSRSTKTRGLSTVLRTPRVSRRVPSSRGDFARMNGLWPM